MHQMVRRDLADGGATGLKSPVKSLVTSMLYGVLTAANPKATTLPIFLPFRNSTEDVPSTLGSVHAPEDAKLQRPKHS